MKLVLSCLHSISFYVLLSLILYRYFFFLSILNTHYYSLLRVTRATSLNMQKYTEFGINIFHLMRLTFLPDSCSYFNTIVHAALLITYAHPMLNTRNFYAPKLFVLNHIA